MENTIFLFFLNIYFCLNFLIFFKKNFEMNFFHSKNINLFLKSKFQQLS